MINNKEDKKDLASDHFHFILKILEQISRDRLWGFIDENESKRLYDKLNEYWMEVNKIDVENGFIPHGNLSKLISNKK